MKRRLREPGRHTDLAPVSLPPLAWGSSLFYADACPEAPCRVMRVQSIQLNEANLHEDGLASGGTVVGQNSYSTHPVGNVQRIHLGRQPHVSLLLSIRSANAPIEIRRISLG
jgi:hypothetical protein